MKYVIFDEVFEKLPTACVATAVIRGADNTKAIAGIEELMQANIAVCEGQFEGIKVKEAPDIVVYREAFRALGLNPNKFMCSIEALLTRIAKKKGFPCINPLVDLGNAVSIKYHLPMGAHDLLSMKGDLEVRFATGADTFVPFGETAQDNPDVGELVYVSGNEVRTRRWTWRQSEVGKIAENTTDIFIPIDGFTDFNKDATLKARDELAELLVKYFGIEPTLGFVDRSNPEFVIPD